MPRERIRPYSRQHWQERLRQYSIQQSSKKWAFGWMGALILGVFVIAVLFTAYQIIPRDMKGVGAQHVDDTVMSVEEKLQKIEQKLGK